MDDDVSPMCFFRVGSVSRPHVGSVTESGATSAFFDPPTLSRRALSVSAQRIVVNGLTGTLSTNITTALVLLGIAITARAFERTRGRGDPCAAGSETDGPTASQIS